MKFFVKNMSILLVTGLLLHIMIITLDLLSGNIIWGIALGFVCSFVFVSSGFMLFYYALKKRGKIFMRTIIASILGRLLFLVLTLILILRSINLDVKMFFLSLFGWYFIFQILEIISFNKLAVKGS